MTYFNTAECTAENLERWLDGLVDGELPEEKQRQLLQRLEEIPGGWRRCALAFLEARAWQVAMPAMVQKAADSERSVAVEPPAPAAPRRGLPLAQSLASWLTMAASFLLAFGAGLVLGDYYHGWSATAVSAVKRGTIVSDTGAKLAGSPDLGASRAGQQAPIQWSAMRVRLDSPEGRPQELTVPIVEGPDVEQWLRHSPTGLPSEIVAQLERSGFRVQTQRRLLPVDLEDGRRAIVPVDEVRVINASLTQP